MKQFWWKVLQFPLTRIVVAVAFIAVPKIVLDNVVLLVRRAGSIGESASFDFAAHLVLAAVLFLSYRLYVRLVERREATEFSFARAGQELGAGFGIGAGLMTALIAVLWLSGTYHAGGVNPSSILLTALLSSLWTGFFEELVFRGIVYRIAEEGLGTWIALGVTAALFGLAHLGNPNSSTSSAAAIALEAGPLLGAAFVLTRRLWMAIGMHAAWNYTQGGVFGASVSGTDAHGWLRATIEGPGWLTGGEFGPEASVIAVLLGLVAFGVLMRLAIRRGRILAPAWAKKGDRAV